MNEHGWFEPDGDGGGFDVSGTDADGTWVSRGPVKGTPAVGDRGVIRIAPSTEDEKEESAEESPERVRSAEIVARLPDGSWSLAADTSGGT